MGPKASHFKRCSPGDRWGLPGLEVLRRLRKRVQKVYQMPRLSMALVHQRCWLLVSIRRLYLQIGLQVCFSSCWVAHLLDTRCIFCDISEIA